VVDNKSGCYSADFQFRLTPKQPLVFDAQTGETGITDTKKGPPAVAGFGGGELEGEFIGALKCWAVNSSGNQQIFWNYLKGEANHLLSRWCLGIQRSPLSRPGACWNQREGGSGNGRRDHPEWQCQWNGCVCGMPGLLLFQFLAEYDPADVLANNQLTLLPCKEDFRQEGTPTTTKATSPFGMRTKSSSRAPTSASPASWMILSTTWEFRRTT